MIDHGGCAFPINGGYHENQDNGMTLRDYFAAKAMQGFAANSEANWSSVIGMAEFAYKWADAMIEARKQGE